MKLVNKNGIETTQAKGPELYVDKRSKKDSYDSYEQTNKNLIESLNNMMSAVEKADRSRLKTYANELLDAEEKVITLSSEQRQKELQKYKEEQIKITNLVREKQIKATQEVYKNKRKEKELEQEALKAELASTDQKDQKKLDELNTKIAKIDEDLKKLDKEEQEASKETVKRVNKNARKSLKKTVESEKKNLKASFESGDISRQEYRQQLDYLKNIYSPTAKERFYEIATTVMPVLATFTSITSFEKAVGNATKKLTSFVDAMGSTITSIADSQLMVDTAMQGSRSATKNGSYWKALSSDISSALASSPYVKQSDVANNVKELVSKGITFNVEERAFLQSLSGSIAASFTTNNETLNDLIRIQQADTTAARLGMESKLTGIMNSLYETSEYMYKLASSVSSYLYEAESLMSATDAVSFEYQVQKWLGSLYSSGASSSSVSGIASALGKLASGDISSISDSSSTLLIMSANNAGISISDILTRGLTAKDTNELLNSMVDYLQKLYENSKDNKVIQQQIANVYGLKASDLKAIASISSNTKTSLSNSYLSYSSAISHLQYMTSTISDRTSLPKMIDNLFDNMQYTLAEKIGNSASLYTTYKIAGLLESAFGGINIPSVTTIVGGVDLNATVAQLLKIGVGGVATISAIGTIIGSLKNIDTNNLLKSFGITTAGLTTTSRGTSLLTTSTTASGSSLSSSGYVGNSSGSDIKNATISSANDEAISATDTTDEVTLEIVNSNVVAIYELLNSVVSGEKVLHVKDNTLMGGITSGWTQTLL